MRMRMVIIIEKRRRGGAGDDDGDYVPTSAELLDKMGDQVDNLW